MIPEVPEQFRVMLAMATPLPGIVLTPDVATVAIHDNDGKWLVLVTMMMVSDFYL